MRELDLRGLSCPEPSVRVRLLLRAEALEALRVLVDDLAACEHLERLGVRLGYTVRVVRSPEHDEVVLTRATRPA